MAPATEKSAHTNHHNHSSNGQTGNISFHTKYKLYKSLVISSLLYRCETWTLLVEAGKRD